MKTFLQYIEEGKSDFRETKNRVPIIYHHILKWCYLKDAQMISWVSDSILGQIASIKNSEAEKKSNLNKVEPMLSELYEQAKRSAAEDNSSHGGKQSGSKAILEDKENIFQYINTMDKLLNYNGIYRLLLKYSDQSNIYALKECFIKKGIVI